MLTLAIETSNPSTADQGALRPGVAFGTITGGKVELLDHEPLDAGARPDDDLLPAIDRLAQRCGITPKQIGAVAVSVGPGGFTGLRVAVSSAQALAHACGAETIAVPTARVAVHACPLAAPSVVCLASKRGETFAQIVDGATLHEGHVVDSDGLAAMIDTSEVAIAALASDASLPDAMNSACAERGIEMVPLRLGPAACLAAAAGLEPEDPAMLAPIYPREPEAVRKWRELHGG